MFEVGDRVILRKGLEILFPEGMGYFPPGSKGEVVRVGGAFGGLYTVVMEDTGSRFGFEEEEIEFEGKRGTCQITSPS